jgi:UDP-N-acetyl-D-glucosamine dehydrogenase
MESQIRIGLQQCDSCVRGDLHLQDGSRMDNLHPPISYAVTRKLIRDRSARIGIVGLSHVGLPLAMFFSECGFVVEGFEIDETKLESFRKRTTYLKTITAERIARACDRGFRATHDLAQIAETDVLILCVPTPLGKNLEPDLRCIRETVYSVAAHLHSGHLVILESTTCPGTTEEIVAPILEQANAAHLKLSRDAGASDRIFVAFSPEYQNLGRPATVDTGDIPKIVGGIDRFSTELATVLYSAIFSQVIPVSTPRVAEMSNLFESTHSCVNAGLVSEMKRLCYLMGIDPWEVIGATKAASFSSTCGNPSTGMGSNCTPTAPLYLSWQAKAYGFRPKFVESAGEFYAGLPSSVVRCTSDALNRQKKSIYGSLILVLGTGYRTNVHDPRESPSWEIVELFRRAGAEVGYCESILEPASPDGHQELKIFSPASEDLSSYDVVVITTDDTTYDFNRIVSRAKLVIDTGDATRGINSDKIVRC